MRWTGSAPRSEDQVVYCPSCEYAANIEKATARLADPVDEEGPAAPERFATPGVRTIEDLAAGYGATGDRQIKTLVYVLDDALTLVLLRGDHALNEQKLVDATGATAVRPARADEITEALGAMPGSLGAWRRGCGGHHRRPAGAARREVPRRGTDRDPLPADGRQARPGRGRGRVHHPENRRDGERPAGRSGRPRHEGARGRPRVSGGYLPTRASRPRVSGGYLPTRAS